MKRKFFRSPEKAFVLFGLVFGMAFLLLTPPLQAPDEWNHFFRAYQISEGRLISKKDPRGVAGGDIPVSLLVTSISIFYDLPYAPENLRKLNYLTRKGIVGDEEMNPFISADKDKRVETMLSLLKMPLNAEKRTFMYFMHTAVYSPVSYLPQAAGIAVGRGLGLSPLSLLYAGRLFNLIVWVLLIYLAIRTTPFLKWLFFSLALVPTSLFLASSLSVDCLTNGLSFYLVAFLLSLSFDEQRRVGATEIVLLFSVSMISSMTKYYIFIPCLFLLVPREKMGVALKYATFVALLISTTLPVAAWVSFAKGYFIAIDPSVSPQRQLSFITSDPLNYALVVVNTLLRYGPDYLRSFAGRLGHFPLYLPTPVVASTWAVLLFTALSGADRDVSISFKARALAATIIALSTLFVATCLYMTWTTVGNNLIEGLQGRYIIPLSPLIFLTVYNRRLMLKEDRFGPLLAAYFFVLLTFTSYALVRGYYL
jgi:uncharacterized membrane protein